MFPRQRLLSLLAPVFILCLAAASNAQTFRGGISGRVADSTGAVLPGVTITATNDATGVSRTTDNVRDRRLFGAGSPARDVYRSKRPCRASRRCARRSRYRYRRPHRSS